MRLLLHLLTCNSRNCTTDPPALRPSERLANHADGLPTGFVNKPQRRGAPLPRSQIRMQSSPFFGAIGQLDVEKDEREARVRKRNDRRQKSLTSVAGNAIPGQSRIAASFLF